VQHIVSVATFRGAARADGCLGRCDRRVDCRMSSPRDHVDVGRLDLVAAVAEVVNEKTPVLVRYQGAMGPSQ
jgi:hypothetical protein